MSVGEYRHKGGVKHEKPLGKKTTPHRRTDPLLLLAIGIGIGLQGRGVVQAEETTIKPTMVRVQGYAEQTTAPTIAYLTLGAQSQADDVKTAQAQNTKDMDAVLGAITEKGIPDNHIQTVNYYVNPRYDNYGASITGYEVIHAVRVKWKTLTRPAR